MNIRYFKSLLILVVAGLFTSCASVKVNRPLEQYEPVSFIPKPSVISFNIVSDIKAIQADLNRQLQGLLLEDNSFENNGGDNVMFKAWKQGEIVLEMEGSTLSYSVPLKIWAKAGFSVNKFGIKLEDYREFNTAISLEFNTNITLNPDWTVTTKTVSAGYNWITTPTVKIAGIDLSVKFIADIIMQASQKRLGNAIDESIKDYLNFKPYVEEAWQEMTKPVLLNDKYNVWLEIYPDKVISSKLFAERNQIKHNAGVTGSLMLKIGNDKQGSGLSAFKAKTLPNILIGNVPTDKTTIYAYATIPFSEINNRAGEYLKGKEFSHGKRKVRIEDIKIYGSAGSLIAETTLSGSLKGIIYFKGTPAYNAKDSTIIIQNFDYDLSTKNFLIKSASWLYQDGFKRMIAENLSWSIAKELKLVRTTINSSLKKYELSEGILLQGVIQQVVPGKITITSDAIVPEIEAAGKVSVLINGVKR